MRYFRFLYAMEEKTSECHYSFLMDLSKQSFFLMPIRIRRFANQQKKTEKKSDTLMTRTYKIIHAIIPSCHNASAYVR
jgi:hypothetical protein